ncbi:MAG: PAS domain S-box protein [Mucilaginibacter sp.]
MTNGHLSYIRYYEDLPVAVYVCDRDDALVGYNTAAASLLGIKPLKGSTDWYPSLQKFDEEGRSVNARYKPVTIAIKASPGSHQQELRFRLSDGTDRYILVSSVAIRDEHGNYDGAIHTLTDLTALRHFESQQFLLASIVNSSADAIITKDLDDHITSWNKGAEELFGYAASEAIGKHISLIIPAERLTEEKRIIKAISKGKKIQRFETMRKTKSGHLVPVSVTASPVLNAQGKIIGAAKILRDISRQKHTEEQLKNYTTHLEDTVKKRTKELDQALNKERELGQLKSRFVSMASHEFRTPLSSVKLSASLIEKYAQPYANQQISKHITKIKNSVDDLSAILGDFLSLEKLESGKVTTSPAKFEITDFCQEITAEMQLLARHGQKLVYHHQGPGALVVLDQQLLKNCMHNLLSNAIKYSGEGTQISLSTELRNGQLSLSVSDQGIGIPEADQRHLFSPFFRAGNTGTIQGTGLGLNIVARYMGLMNGTIDFKSEPGRGTTFTLHFTQPETAKKI